MYLSSSFSSFSFTSPSSHFPYLVFLFPLSFLLSIILSCAPPVYSLSVDISYISTYLSVITCSFHSLPILFLFHYFSKSTIFNLFLPVFPFYCIFCTIFLLWCPLAMQVSLSWSPHLCQVSSCPPPSSLSLLLFWCCLSLHCFPSFFFHSIKLLFSSPTYSTCGSCL